ncbi:HDOD domain-containing protein [Candidatus Scalindua japonica]|uniref:HDOD domain-containing protein n=1 Tax=Candidatus Scalindua japonica TaxID=1284222 RepID=UPI000BDEC821|nr:HDOD domain-containing protein [Candidatus Scalindua japonica]
MSKITLAGLLIKVKNMPPLPQSIIQILELTKNPESSANDLAKVFERDPKLAANILKLANSPYYGFSRTISTISHAIVCLGIDTIKSIALTSSTQEMLNNEIPAYALEKGMLWQHSIGCAVCARIIAKRIGFKESEEAYIAGLLLDIGKIILSNYAEDQFVEIIKKSKNDRVPFDRAEQEVLGFDHAKIGGKIIKKWNLPPILVDAVQYHHQPEKAKTHKKITYIVHLADSISCMLGIGLGCDGLMYVFEENTLDILGIHKDDLEFIMSELVDKVFGTEQSYNNHAIEQESFEEECHIITD